VTFGQSVTYTLVVSNSGPSTAAGAAVADTPPAALSGVTFTSAVTAGTATGNTASGKGALSDTLTLAPNSTVTYTLTGIVTGQVSGTLSNTATLAAPAGFTDTNPANNSATATNSVTPGVPVPPALVFVNPAYATLAPGSRPAGTPAGILVGISAFPTIQQGLDAVSKGGTVNVAAGTYSEHLVFRQSVIVQGAGSATTTLSGDQTGVGLNITTANGVQISGLTVRGFNTALVAGAATSYLSLTDVPLTGNRFGGSVAGTSTVLVQGSSGNDTFFVTPQALAQPGGNSLAYSNVMALTIDGGGGSDTLQVFLNDTTAPDTVWLNAGALSRDKAFFLLYYRDTGGTFGGGVAVVLGNGPETAVVQGQLAGAPTSVFGQGSAVVFNVAVTSSSGYAGLTLDGGGNGTLLLFDKTGGATGQKQLLPDGSVEIDVNYPGGLLSRIHDQNIAQLFSDVPGIV
jgi:uncharacterized repeat protein (TIGR01451 family)